MTERCVNCSNLMGSIRRQSSALDQARDDHERQTIQMEQEILDLRRANRANKSRWKNARRDFVAVKGERDALRQVIAETIERLDDAGIHPSLYASLSRHLIPTSPPTE